MTESARTTVRQETSAVIAQAEYFCRGSRAIVVRNANDFAFSEMIAAAVRAELTVFSPKFTNLPPLIS